MGFVPPHYGKPIKYTLKDHLLINLILLGILAVVVPISIGVAWMCVKVVYPQWHW
jgi:hypothetical protein